MSFKSVLIVCLIFVCFSPDAFSYSVLTHEAIIDTLWIDSIQPLLKQRFPRATDRDLKAAHAYVYGGSIIQDMGYYPFGSKFFTDLTHYVRSGDFVGAMLRDSVTLYEYAFALGSMAHYVADTEGHPLGTNRAVPLLYPKLQRRFGNEVTYSDNPLSHLKTEFGFDVLEVAKGRFAPDAYRDFVGFEVSKPLLQRSFQRTYGLDLNDVFATLDLAVGTYRKTVSGLIPKMTQVAWEMKKDDIEKSQPGMTRNKFLYNISRAEYEKQFGTQYRTPGFGTRVLAAVIRVLPKLGPLRALSFKMPTPQAEKLFMDSFNATIEKDRSLLATERARQDQLADLNLDVGKETTAGTYKMADDAYAKLVKELAGHQFAGIPTDLRENILAFYKNEDAPISTRKHRKEWAKLQQELAMLRSGTSTK
jgi:hypothetical protein